MHGQLLCVIVFNRQYVSSIHRPVSRIYLPRSDLAYLREEICCGFFVSCIKNGFKDFPQTLKPQEEMSNCDVLPLPVSLSLKFFFASYLPYLSLSYSFCPSFFLSLIHFMSSQIIQSDQCSSCECLSPLHVCTFLLRALHLCWPSGLIPHLTNHMQQDLCIQSLL